MFIITGVLRNLGALAVAVAATAGMGLVYVTEFLPADDDEGITAYEREYRRRGRFEGGLITGAILGTPGALIGLKAAAEGRPRAIRRAAGYGALVLVPFEFLLFLIPYTTMLVLWVAPLITAAGALAGLLSATFAPAPRRWKG